ncbi:hypothetical protein OOK41_14105 [Micromonospora sp. NBC_01655]|nr:hypothetical protein [Micromonospora sp. NBC_01655]MCX4471425.1 hypothetical protein [Micromonospora sp. NBC_01655]
MPLVSRHKRGGKPVRGYYRLNSIWNFWFGLILMLFFFAYVSKHQ